MNLYLASAEIRPRTGVISLSLPAADRYLRPDILSNLIIMLNDSDDRVRTTTLYTLACDRCKEGSCRPEEAHVLPAAIKLLASDPSAHVRAMAVEVIGQFVHGNPSAVEAIEAATRSDKSSAVRKKAGWYAPGGTIYNRSLPKRRKRAVALRSHLGRACRECATRQ